MRTRRLAALLAVLLGGALLTPAHGATAEAAAAPVTDYVVGVEDALRVFVWGEPDLSLRVQVRPDGKITVPLVNDVRVVGMTTEQIRQKIRDALSGYLREPLVTVILEEINSYRVYFLGEIQNQGAMQFYRPTTLLQGVAAAGGLTEFSKKTITILRVESGVEKRMRIDYKRLITGDSSEETIYLQPGDTLLFN